MSDIETKFKFRPEEPADEARLTAAQQRLETNHNGLSNPDQVVADILLFDRMGRATMPVALDAWRKLAKDLDLEPYVGAELTQAGAADDNERAMDLLRASWLIGVALERPRGLLRFFFPLVVDPVFETLYENQKQKWEAKHAPRIAWDPEDLTGKPQEWIYAWRDAERRWGAATNLPTANSPAAIMSRFDFGMKLMHEDMFGTGFTQSEAPRVRAMFDYMLTRIWPNPALMEKFLSDASFNAIPSGLAEPQDFHDLPKLAQIIYIPEQLRGRPTLPFAEKAKLRPFYRRILTILHPDLINADADVSLNLKDACDFIGRKIHPLWTEAVEKLI